jgi:hypothetical protein
MVPIWKPNAALARPQFGNAVFLATEDVRACPETAGAGEGIRTLDPDLGKVVLYP